MWKIEIREGIIALNEAITRDCEYIFYYRFVAYTKLSEFCI